MPEGAEPGKKHDAPVDAAGLWADCPPTPLTCMLQWPFHCLLQSLLHICIAANFIPGHRRNLNSSTTHNGRPHTLHSCSKVSCCNVALLLEWVLLTSCT